MPPRDQLNCLAKRDLLNQSAVSVESLLSWGKQHEEAGSLHDAVDFYEKAKATEALNAVLETVQEEGDTFLFIRINRILNREPDRSEWLALADRAEKLGKHAFAAQALRHLDTEDSPEQAAAKS